MAHFHADMERSRKKISLSRLWILLKTARDEMCSSNRTHFHCLRFAGVRGVTTAFPSESYAAVRWRGDRDKKPLKSAFCQQGVCGRAEITAVLALDSTRDLREKWVLSCR
jgi:hypothetical protein